MIHEVTLPYGGLGDALLEEHRWNIWLPASKSSQSGYMLLPRDHLCYWLTACTPSLQYFHEVQKPIGYMTHWNPTGMVFAFAKHQEAVLFKITWA